MTDESMQNFSRDEEKEFAKWLKRVTESPVEEKEYVKRRLDSLEKVLFEEGKKTGNRFDKRRDKRRDPWRIFDDCDDDWYRVRDMYLSAFLKRNKMNMESLVIEMRKIHSRLSHECNTKLNRYDWMKVLLNSGLVIEVIWRYSYPREQPREAEAKEEEEEEEDPLSRPSFILYIRTFLLLQFDLVPFIMLQELFKLCFPASGRTFIHLCIVYFSEFMLFADSSQAFETLRRRHIGQQPSEVKDILDLLRICNAPFVPRQPPPDPTKMVAMRRATQLDEAGVIIIPGSSSVCTIRYSKGILEIPKIKINDKSEFLLKQLIYLELDKHPNDTFIIDYLHFMDGLIDTAKDVDILIKNAVIENFDKDSKAVADLFNGITREAPLYTPGYYYYGVCEELNNFCKKPYNRWRASFKRDYCSSPWLIASTIAAVILLVLTLIQTVCSVISIV